MKQTLHHYYILLLFFIYAPSTIAQVPGINLNTFDALESYTLFEGANSQYTTYLINNCGQVVNTWDLPNISFHPKLLPNGNVMYISNGGRFVGEQDWEGNEVVRITIPGTIRPHYEVVKLPNGNYLMVGRRPRLYSEFEELGWDENWGTPFQSDVVIEVDATTGAIVWEWDIFDHLIQEQFPMGIAYGVVADHPELVNMGAISTFDWKYEESFMINGMDYNPELDQIALSVRKMGEIMIIDHSTTTEEAAGSTGGKYGKGGDILYRWGNPVNYQRAVNGYERVLYLQHNVTWVTEGEHKGKLMVYNNNFGKFFPPGQTPHSAVYVLDPPVDANGFYTLPATDPYGPFKPTISIDQVSTNTQFLSQYGSGVQMLPNRHLYISNAVTGRLMEVDFEGNLKWEYYIPFANFIFRTIKYPLDYPAFADRELEAGTKVLGDNSSYECGWINKTDEVVNTPLFKLQYSPENQEVRVKNTSQQAFDYVLYSMDGKKLREGRAAEAALVLGMSTFPPGMYFLSAKAKESRAWESLKFITVNP